MLRGLWEVSSLIEGVIAELRATSYDIGESPEGWNKASLSARVYAAAELLEILRTDINKIDEQLAKEHKILKETAESKDLDPAELALVTTANTLETVCEILSNYRKDK